MAAEPAPREDQLLETIRLNVSPRERDAACAELKSIATARSIRTLAELLSHPDLSHSARYVLEAMAHPEAGAALRAALGQASGPVRIGIIESIGVRRDAEGVASLRPWLGGDDLPTAKAAAFALGRIGTREAGEALAAAVPKAPAALRPALIDSVLAAAEAARARGDADFAAGLYLQAADAAADPWVQTAAYRGLMLGAGTDAPNLVLAALAGKAGPRQVAALAVARETPGQAMTQTILSVLDRTDPGLQLALVGLLGQRGDPAALPGILRLAAAPREEVRVAALAALGSVGDASAVAVLASAAASGSRDERAAARLALGNLHASGVVEALLQLLETGAPVVQSEMARVLAERGEVQAVPQILRLSRTVPDAVRGAVFEAAGVLARESDLPALVEGVVAAADDTWRGQAAEALNSASQRQLAARGAIDVTSIVRAGLGAPVAARMALFPVCAGLPGPETREVLLKGASDPAPQVREAAIRALADSQDPALVPELARLGCSLTEPNLRALAIAGCARLAGADESRGIDPVQRIAALETVLDCQPTPEQIRRILSGLARISHPRSLLRIEALLANPAVSAEAARAVMQIAPGIQPTDRAIEAVEKALGALPEGEGRAAGRALLEQLQGRKDYLLAWQVAGPYRLAGKDYAALFDAVFPPEQADPQVSWQAIDPGGAARPEAIDLLKQWGGEQCVAYARSWVYSPSEQPALLELGSDDGVKVWFNTALVHANNTARPLQPGSDKAAVKLTPGWNSLLLKVTQNNQGWEFCARFLKPDGTRLPGLKSQAQPPSP